MSPASSSPSDFAVAMLPSGRMATSRLAPASRHSCRLPVWLDRPLTTSPLPDADGGTNVASPSVAIVSRLVNVVPMPVPMNTAYALWLPQWMYTWPGYDELALLNAWIKPPSELVPRRRSPPEDTNRSTP